MSISPRILYVEDNKDSCELLSMMLPLYSDWKCSITTVDNADTALSLMQKQVFDIYIVDYALPGISGIEFCEEIRKSDSRTPIVFYTGMTQECVRKQALNAGANDYLVKPNDLIKLTETIKNLLNKK